MVMAMFLRVLVNISTNVVEGLLRSFLLLIVTIIYYGRGLTIFRSVFLFFDLCEADTTSLSIFIFFMATVEHLIPLSSLPKEIPSLSKLEEMRESKKEMNDLLPGFSRLRIYAIRVVFSSVCSSLFI
jgi:hypothetical protein